MDSSPTLQDFVLNLIYDPIARSAFELDPEAALQDAGLDDVTAADVQEVIPLVVDYAPLAGASGLSGLAGVDDLTTGVANLDVAGAVAQLQAITSQVAFTASQATGDLNIAAAGAFTVTADNLVSGSLLGGAGLTDGSLFGGAGLDLTGLSAEHDPAATLDAGVTAPVDDAVTGLVSGVDSLAPVGTLDGALNTVTGLPSSTGLTGPLDLDVSGVTGATSSVVGSLVGPDTVGGVLHDPIDHVGGTIGTVDDTVSGVTGTLGLGHETDPDAGHEILGGITDLHF